MNTEIRQKIIEICNKKIEVKGENVGLSFYAFFANKNYTPELQMEVAEWWILEHKLDHFEKATKIREMVLNNELKKTKILIPTSLWDISETGWNRLSGFDGLFKEKKAIKDGLPINIFTVFFQNHPNNHFDAAL